MNQEEQEIQINNVYDYSNSIIELQNILYLIQYMEYYYNQVTDLYRQDEEKNEMLKTQFKYFQFKKTYHTQLEIDVRNKKHDLNVKCKTYNDVFNAANSGRLNNVEKITIELDLSFKRGKDMNQVEHENVFKISFEPYNIIFTRKANHNDSGMDQIENTINEIMKKMDTKNTIFYSKD